MNIIINASNLRVGGAIQVALSLFNELYAYSNHHFHIFLSPAFIDIINNDLYKNNNLKVYFVDHPSRFTINGRVKQLDELERGIKPDCVFSIFGPTYWNPKSPHMSGFAQGYYLYNELPFFKMLRLYQKIRLKLLMKYHGFLLKEHSEQFIVETNDVKERLGVFLDIDKDKISVVSNTYSNHFSNYECSIPNWNGRPFKLLTVAYPYLHKNLNILKDVSVLLNKYNVECEFYITVSNDYYDKNFSGFEKFIKNLGPVRNCDCPKIYESMDAMILPSLVECFSASYPEAMKMKRPILTSDYSFARSICGNAALYFDPINPLDIADKIKLLISDDCLYKEIVSAGTDRLSHFLSPKERSERYINLLASMVQEHV